MSRERKTPRRRFKKFQNDREWEQRKLGDVVTIIMGQSPDGTTYSETPSDYILVQGNADLKEGWVFPRVWTTQKTKIATAGDLIMSVRAPAGAMGKTAYDTVIGRGVAAIKGNEFIYQTLVKMNQYGYWNKYSCGSTFESLNSDNIKNAEIQIPDVEEQNDIGDYFKKLDNLITLNQRKLEKLKALKKAYLTQMFPSEGESKPKLRFAGFNDKWVQCKLRDNMKIVTDYVAAGSFADLAENVVYESNPSYAQLVRTVDIKNKFSNDGFIYINKRAFEYLWRVNLNEESIILPNIGANIGEVYYIEPNTLPYQNNVLGPNAILLRPKENTKFLFNLFQTTKFQRRLFITVASSGQPKFNKTELKEIEYLIPNKKEQDYIGSFFEKLDKLISLHQHKLEKLQNLKKAYLNEMFV